MALAWKAGWVNALRGSNPLSSASVMSRDIVEAPESLRGLGCDFFVVPGFAGGLGAARTARQMIAGSPTGQLQDLWPDDCSQAEKSRHLHVLAHVPPERVGPLPLTVELLRCLQDLIHQQLNTQRLPGRSLASSDYARTVIFKAVGNSRPYPDHGFTVTEWAELPPAQVRLAELTTTKETLDLHALLAEDSTFFGDLFAHVVKWKGDLYLEDGLHRAVRAALQQRPMLHARTLDLDTVDVAALQADREK